MNRRSAQQSRKEILRAALKVFCDKGYKQTSIREIAHHAHISVGGVYVYFKNKESLYLELISEQAEDFEKQIGPLRNEDPLFALRSYIETNIGYALKRRKLVSHHLKDHDLQFTEPFRNDFFNSQRRLLEDILTSGEKIGLFTVNDRKSTALLILFAIRGAIISHFTNRRVDLNGLEEALCNIVLIKKGESLARSNL